MREKREEVHGNMTESQTLGIGGCLLEDGWDGRRVDQTDTIAHTFS